MNRNYSVMDVSDIIHRGDIETLKKIENICEKQSSHFSDALSMNRLDIFIFLYNFNWPNGDINVNFVDIGAETILYCNLDAMKYLHSKGYSFDKKGYSIIAVGRIRFKLPRLLHFLEDLEFRPPKDREGLKMIQFLKEVSCPITEDSYISASVSGNIECVRFLNEHCHCPWHVSSNSCAIIGRQMDIFLYSATHGAPITLYVKRFLHRFNFQSSKIRETKIMQKYFDPDCESIILSFLEINMRGFDYLHIRKDKRFIRDIIKKGIGNFKFCEIDIPHPRIADVDLDGDYGISVLY